MVKDWFEKQNGLIERYYEEIVSEVNPKFKKYSFKTNKTVICPLHDDNDPSMGVIVSKGKERFHCFGCGAWGGVLDLVERVNTRWGIPIHGKSVEQILTESLGLEIPTGVQEGSSEKEHPIKRRRRLMRENMRSYGRDDFQRGILSIAKGENKIGYLDSLMVTIMLQAYKDKITN